jgi:hypothetical protein
MSQITSQNYGDFGRLPMAFSPFCSATMRPTSGCPADACFSFSLAFASGNLWGVSSVKVAIALQDDVIGDEDFAEPCR